MAEEARLRFVEAMRELEGPMILEILPRLTRTDLDVIRQYWLRGHLGKLDPTNVLCAADYADQFLSLPEHAIALYDAALEFMDKNPGQSRTIRSVLQQTSTSWTCWPRRGRNRLWQ